MGIRRPGRLIRSMRRRRRRRTWGARNSRTRVCSGSEMGWRRVVRIRAVCPDDENHIATRLNPPSPLTGGRATDTYVRSARARSSRRIARPHFRFRRPYDCNIPEKLSTYLVLFFRRVRHLTSNRRHSLTHSLSFTLCRASCTLYRSRRRVFYRTRAFFSRNIGSALFVRRVVAREIDDGPRVILAAARPNERA